MEELEQSSPFVSPWGRALTGDRDPREARCLVLLASRIGQSAVARSIVSSTLRAHRCYRFSLLDERPAAYPSVERGRILTKGGKPARSAESRHGRRKAGARPKAGALPLALGARRDGQVSYGTRNDPLRAAAVRP